MAEQMDINFEAMQNSDIAEKVRAFSEEVKARRSNPDEVDSHAQETIDEQYRMMPDGVDAETGMTFYSAPRPTSPWVQRMFNDPTIIDAEYEVICDDMQSEVKSDLHEEQQNVSPKQRARATKKTVDEKVPNQPVGDASFVENIKRMMFGRQPETQEVKAAKTKAARSRRTERPPEVQQIEYRSNSCTSRGKSIEYKEAFKIVDWGSAIKKNSGSIAESVEHLVSYLTNAIRDSYGGWSRITEIIVRDQRLIINRSCFCPVIDPDTIDANTFPLDTISYLKAGALASFFDWSMLKHMRCLNTLDIDDMGFYEVNIGGRLKCGRRIGISSIFNLVPSLEVLVLGGDSVTREELETDKATPMKKRLADHKRFSLFCDGYKIEVCKNTHAFAGWTFNNMKNYACNKGNKNLFVYCGGVVMRAGLATISGIADMGAHLVGGIRNIFRDAMTPIDPVEEGLQ